MAFSDILRILEPSWAPVRLTLWLTSSVFGWHFVALPKFARRWVPHSDAVLSMGFLYVFAQALGLMWLVVVNLFSVCSVNFVKHIQAYLEGQAVDIHVAVSSILTGYVHYCIMRMLFFVGSSFYLIGWEAFSDFPTVRRLVVGRGSRASADLQQQHQLPTPARQRGARSALTPTKAHGNGTLPRRPHFPSASSLSKSPLLETSEEDQCSTPEHLSPSLVAQSSPEQASPSLVDREDSTHFQRSESGEDAPLEPAAAAQGAGRQRRKRRQFFREATLLAPLMGLIACTLAVVLLTGACQVASFSCESEFLGSLAHPTGRLNRGIRFALFVSFLQWVQAFLYLFPTWHKGLLSTGFGKIWSLAATPFWPLAFGRLTQWLLVPAGTGITQQLLGHIPHHLVDISIIMVLKIWMFGACICVLKRPELSGFDRRRRLIEDDDWREMATLFKYWFLVPTMIHFARGCVKFGFVGAQNDLLVIVCAYPLLLVTVWTIVWAVVVAPGANLLLAGAAGSLSLASTICSVAVPGRQVGATIVVWLHLMRQYLKMFKGKADKNARAQSLAAQRTEASASATEHSEASGGDSPKSGWHQAGQASQLHPHPPERKVARVFMIYLALVAVTFFGVLASLAVIASLQKKIDWYPSTIWFEREQDPKSIVVDHTVSRIRLKERSGNSLAEGNVSTGHSAAGGVSYSACAHSWHGLHILDYALLSLASYFDLADPSLPQLLNGIFPAWLGLGWKLRNSTSSCPKASRGTSGSGSRLSWIEVEVHDPAMERPLLVIALRGTDPVRVSDYIEDIRMWTEPVALSILSTVFPTVRAWPRKTVEMVITGIHDFMGMLGMPNDNWSYMELVNCISRIPHEQYSQIVLTGHSLGGGMATVVAALTHLPVVGITPPGIYWIIAKHSRLAERSRAKDDQQGSGPGGDNHDVSRWMHHQSLTLVVENDWVNGIFDDHGGLVQMMTCDRSQEDVLFACHMLEGTICHIFDHCGDPRKRWDACTHEYNLKEFVNTTATKVLREVTQFGREVMPSEVQAKFNGLYSWAEQPWAPKDPGSIFFGNTVALLCVFFIALPILCGIIEDFLIV